MQAIELISGTIQPLNPRDTVARALDLMDEFRTGVLPVVSKGRLVGLMKEEAALDNNKPTATVEMLMDKVEIPYVRERQHFYDVLKLMAELGLPMVPVLDMGGRYLGVVSEHDAMRHMAELVNASGPGSVLVLEMARNDYSLQQIARIVEDEGARLLSVYCTDMPDSTRMEVTLKINREDISAILQSFDRYEYNVRTTFQGSRTEDNLRSRYEDVMRIIKM
ncbi:MAG: CBS domain-containing protein [Flavobacteriales bacterium]|jgi:CBS domain-containing protein|nr:CBS domain-containing protein [Flavobacteriales bacterium]MCB0759274.1 CBS domain-containing protein [Flavobacteriales bacterium]